MGERLAVDTARSEVGKQRRTDRDGRALHCCCVCGKLETWTGDWSWYGSYRDVDDGKPLAKFCSASCKAKGGPVASLVTEEMMAYARQKEFREPETVYRPMTDSEQYGEALAKQRARMGADHD